LSVDVSNKWLPSVKTKPVIAHHCWQGENELGQAPFASTDKRVGKHAQCGDERMAERCGTSYRGCYKGTMAHGTHIIAQTSQGFND